MSMATAFAVTPNIRKCWASLVAPAVTLGIVAAILGLMAAPLWLFGLDMTFDAEQLAATMRGFGAAGVLIFIAAMAASVLIGPIPTAPFAIAAGVLYGAGLGTAVAVAGSLLGAAAAFLVARVLGERLLRRHPAIARLTLARGSPRSLFWVILTARLVPVLSFALVSYGAGLSGISLRGFAVASALGMLPMTALCAATGSGLPIVLR